VDYRAIVRQFEVERMLSDEGVNRNYFGVRYSDILLERIYDTDVAKLDRLFPTFPPELQALYVLTKFSAEIDNGGISQFFFNARPGVRRAVPAACALIGDHEVMNRTADLFAKAEEVSVTRHRLSVRAWDDYLDYTDTFSDTADEFNDWFYGGYRQELDRRMRAFITAHMDRYLLRCEGAKHLERLWMKKKLARIVDRYRWYSESDRKGTGFNFFDLLFTPDARESLGLDEAARCAAAQAIAGKCYPSILRAARSPSRACFSAGDMPRIEICGRSFLRRFSAVTLLFYEEHEMDMLWGIASWSRPSMRG